MQNVLVAHVSVWLVTMTPMESQKMETVKVSTHDDNLIDAPKLQIMINIASFA